MKKTLSGKGLWILLLVMLLSVSCYDDSAIWSEIKDQEARIVKLELLTEQFNTNLSSLQTIVGALKANDYATNVTPIVRNGKDVGFTMTFSKKEPVTIYFGEVSVGDLNGAFPKIGLAKDTDGNYYWTLDGLWLTDDSGDKVPASGKAGEDGIPGAPGTPGKDGVTPKLKITDGKWYVSYDNGGSWEVLGSIPVTNTGSGSSIFSGVRNLENSVILTLNDGTEIVVPKKKALNLVLSELKPTSALFTGVANPVSPDYEVGIYYSADNKVQVQTSEKVLCYDFDEDNGFEIRLTGLRPATTYYWRSYVSMYGDVEYGDVQSFTTVSIGDGMGIVSGLTTVRTYADGDVSKIDVRYAYDSEFRIKNMEIEQKDDFQNESGTDWTSSVSFMYTADNRIVCNSESTDERQNTFITSGTANLDDAGRVVEISDVYQSQYYSSSSVITIEYLSDGKQKKMVNEEGETSSHSIEFTYMNGALASWTDRRYGDGYEEHETITYDPDVMFPNRYPADRINLNLNMVLMMLELDGTYEALSHVGHCGTMLGDYLFEKIDTESGVYDIPEHNVTIDKSYAEHISREEYRVIGDELADVEYEFNEEGWPVKLSAKQPYGKYKVEYDLVAGELAEWSSPEYPQYMLVRKNQTETFVATVYETIEWTVSYLGEFDVDGTPNEGVGENDGVWEN